jgi:hypothetical protein
MRADEQVERQIADPLAVEGSVTTTIQPCTVSILSPVIATSADGVPKAFPTYRRTGSIAWWL